MKYEAKVIYDPRDDLDHLVINMKGESVDEALKVAYNLPETKEFLKTSTLGFEYINISFNHGEDISLEFLRYPIK